MLIPETVFFVIGFWTLVALVLALATHEWLATRRLRNQAVKADALLQISQRIACTLELRVEKAEKHIRQLMERQGQLALSGEGRPYDLAIDLVRRGADADKLISNFGMSHGEAHLVTLMHGGRSRKQRLYI